MKREEVRSHIPGITDEALKWLMDENGADINREKARAETLQKQLDAATGQLQTVQDQLKAFDGKDVAALEAQVAKLTRTSRTRPTASPLTPPWTAPSGTPRAGT